MNKKHKSTPKHILTYLACYATNKLQLCRHLSPRIFLTILIKIRDFKNLNC